MKYDSGENVFSSDLSVIVDSCQLRSHTLKGHALLFWMNDAFNLIQPDKVLVGVYPGCRQL